jgi:hypothetical protein
MNYATLDPSVSQTRFDFHEVRLLSDDLSMVKFYFNDTEITGCTKLGASGSASILECPGALPASDGVVRAEVCGNGYVEANECGDQGSTCTGGSIYDGQDCTNPLAPPSGDVNNPCGVGLGPACTPNAVVGCTADCQGIVPSVCGDNFTEQAEICDGTDLGGETCVSQGFASGTLACALACDAYDTSGCVASVCGNDVTETGEFCDGTDLNGQTCESLGFASGTLGCDVACGAYDTSACVAPSCLVPPSGMVHRWDGNQNAEDRVSNVFSKMQGGVWWSNVNVYPSAAGNYVFDFDGTSSRIQVDDLNAPTGAFTVDAWVYNELTSWNSFMTILEYGDDGFNFGVNSLGQLGMKGGLLSSPGSMLVQTWHHVAYTWNGSTGTLYIDGVAAGSNSVAPPTSGVGLGIGYHRTAAAGDDEWQGFMDEIEIFDRALTPAEISDLATNILGKCTDPLVCTGEPARTWEGTGGNNCDGVDQTTCEGQFVTTGQGWITECYWDSVGTNNDFANGIGCYACGPANLAGGWCTNSCDEEPVCVPTGTSEALCNGVDDVVSVLLLVRVLVCWVLKVIPVRQVRQVQKHVTV